MIFSRLGTVIFVKLVKLVAVGLACWLIWRLVCHLGRKSTIAPPRTHNNPRGASRKFVKSSVVDKEDQADEEK